MLPIIAALIYNYLFYKNNNPEETTEKTSAKASRKISSGKIFYSSGAIFSGLAFSITEFVLFYILMIHYASIPLYSFIFNPCFILIIYIIMLIVSIISFIKIPATEDKNPKSKSKTIVKIVKIVTTVSVYSFLIIGFIYIIFNIPSANKSYEITNINNNKYVILSEYEGDYLVVKYEDTSENTIFFTSEYQLVNKENLHINRCFFYDVKYK